MVTLRDELLNLNLLLRPWRIISYSTTKPFKFARSFINKPPDSVHFRCPCERIEFIQFYLSIVIVHWLWRSLGSSFNLKRVIVSCGFLRNHKMDNALDIVDIFLSLPPVWKPESGFKIFGMKSPTAAFYKTKRCGFVSKKAASGLSIRNILFDDSGSPQRWPSQEYLNNV